MALSLITVFEVEDTVYGAIYVGNNLHYWGSRLAWGTLGQLLNGRTAQASHHVIPNEAFVAMDEEFPSDLRDVVYQPPAQGGVDIENLNNP